MHVAGRFPDWTKELRSEVASQTKAGDRHGILVTAHRSQDELCDGSRDRAHNHRGQLLHDEDAAVWTDGLAEKWTDECAAECEQRKAKVMRLSRRFVAHAVILATTCGPVRHSLFAGRFERT